MNVIVIIHGRLVNLPPVLSNSGALPIYLRIIISKLR